MAKQDSDTGNVLAVTREDLVALLNGDLARNTRPSFPMWSIRRPSRARST